MTREPLPHEPEGVIQYDARHRSEPLPPGLAPLAAALAAWRYPLRALGWLGREEGRYDGYGFGNLSARLGAAEAAGLTAIPDATSSAAPAEPAFLVTGSQTGGRERLDLDGFALVERADGHAHRLWSRGEVAASSESLTHAALYAAFPGVGAVFHVHAPRLWRERHDLGLEETAADVPYGTPEMARAVVAAAERAVGGGQAPGDVPGAVPGTLPGAVAGVLAMAGHEDGLLAWGADPASAGRALLEVAGWW